MTKISIRLHDKMEQNIRRRADKKDLALSDYVRHLIELGLKVEDAAEGKKPDKHSQQNRDNFYKEALIKSMCANVIVKNLFLQSVSQKDQPKRKKILDEIEKNILNYVEETYPDV